jgi:hypothetical protein
MTSVDPRPSSSQATLSARRANIAASPPKKKRPNTLLAQWVPGLALECPEPSRDSKFPTGDNLLRENRNPSKARHYLQLEANPERSRKDKFHENTILLKEES